MTSYLLDTHVLLWAAQDSPSLSRKTREILADPANDILMSIASIWEIVIKSGLRRSDFTANAVKLRQAASGAGYGELPVRGPHVLEVSELPNLHSDPFDRILLGQARVEELILLTRDQKLLEYGSPTQPV